MTWFEILTLILIILVFGVIAPLLEIAMEKANRDMGGHND